MKLNSDENEKLVMVKFIGEIKQSIHDSTKEYEKQLRNFIQRFSNNTRNFEDRFDEMEEIVRDSEDFLQRHHYLDVDYAEVLEALINDEFDNILSKYI